MNTIPTVIRTLERVIRPRWGAVVLVCALSSTGVRANDTAVYVALPGACARPCDTLRIPVHLTNPTDSVAGFALGWVMTRPGVIEFDPADIVNSVGTLTENWEHVSATVLGGTSLRVIGLADLNEPPAVTPGAPPRTEPDTLIYLKVLVLCSPDTFGGSDVVLFPSALQSSFSDPQGNTLAPLSLSSDTIHVMAGALGDMDQNGVMDVVDVVASVGCAFRNSCLRCRERLADTNCDGIVNVVDVVISVGYAFRSQPAPSCS